MRSARGRRVQRRVARGRVRGDTRVAPFVCRARVLERGRKKPHQTEPTGDGERGLRAPGRLFRQSRTQTFVAIVRRPRSRAGVGARRVEALIATRPPKRRTLDETFVDRRRETAVGQTLDALRVRLRARLQRARARRVAGSARERRPRLRTRTQVRADFCGGCGVRVSVCQVGLRLREGARRKARGRPGLEATLVR